MPGLAKSGLQSGPQMTPGTSVVLRRAPQGPIMTVTARIEEKAGVNCIVKWLDIGAHRREAQVEEIDLIRA
jgi:hypothetical protein